MKNYYYLNDIGEVAGPIPLAELDALHKAQRISASTQVCEDGTEKWMPFFQVVRPALPRERIIKKEEVVAEDQPQSAPKKEKGVFTREINSGRFMMAAGFLIITYYNVWFKTAVDSGEMIVNNIGLMNDKQNGIIVGGIISIVGAILSTGKKN
jgi:GYF domain 2